METDHPSIKHLNLTSEQKQAVGFLAEFAERMIVFAFSEERTPTQALTLILEIYKITDEMLNGSYTREPKPTCVKGCTWCCFLRVKVTPLEVLCLEDYLRSHLSTEEISALRQRMIKRVELPRRTEGDLKISDNMACPVMVDGACLAYPVRPVACRTYHSLDASDCAALINHFDGSISVRRDIAGMSVGIIAGMIEGLRKMGLQTRMLELTAGLRIAMEEPGSGLAERWLSGEPSFEQAEMPNAKKIERIHRTLVEELGFSG